jgi:hypothetical protein
MNICRFPSFSDPLDVDHRAANLPFDDPPNALSEADRWARQHYLAAMQHACLGEMLALPLSETEIEALFAALPETFTVPEVATVAKDTAYALAALASWQARRWMVQVDASRYAKAR